VKHITGMDLNLSHGKKCNCEMKLNETIRNCRGGKKISQEHESAGSMDDLLFSRPGNTCSVTRFFNWILFYDNRLFQVRSDTQENTRQMPGIFLFLPFSNEEPHFP